MAIDESILRRAKALNETAKRGGSEAEMTMAAEKLAALLGKYNLDPAVLESDQAVAVIVVAVTGKYNETWRRTCFNSAAELFYCNYYYAGGSWGIRHSIVGEGHNVAVAVEMGQFFEATINRLANEATRNNPQFTDGHTNRHRFIRSFRLGAAQRLQQRVWDYTNQAKRGDLKITDDTGNELRLPALQTLYDRRDTLFQEFLIQNGINLGEGVKPRDQFLSGAGTHLGRLAGESISFTTQVTNSSSKYALK